MTGAVKLPDLRGLFLRGVSGSRNDAWRDPDADGRKDDAGNQVGNRVGSLQEDSLKSHTHPVEIPGDPDADGSQEPYGEVFQASIRYP